MERQKTAPRLQAGPMQAEKEAREREENRMERIRTLKGAVAYFRERDSETVITEYMIRRAVNEGRIPHAKSGNKFLVSIDAVERYFSGQPLEEQPEEKKKPARVVYARRYM